MQQAKLVPSYRWLLDLVTRQDSQIPYIAMMEYSDVWRPGEDVSKNCFELTTKSHF